ncbi:phage holin, lambda family, partial [Pseudomonas aeruginosa]|uniref:phage holin, lambda family n=1 Tax=Pseudomonas aeruginosa TaxID=287 RepID=UPI003BF547B3
MPITEQQLMQIFPHAGPRVGVFVGALNRGMTRFGITSPVRAAAFLAQIGHESAQLTHLVENLNYSARGLAATWPSRYLGADGQPNALAQRLARNPRAIANNAYASRNGNGDEAPETWAALLAWLSAHYPQLYAAGLSFVVALTRVIYGGGTRRQALLEATLCTLITLGLIPVLEWFGLPQNMAT